MESEMKESYRPPSWHRLTPACVVIFFLHDKDVID
jgi:hypothetical protein